MTDDPYAAIDGLSTPLAPAESRDLKADFAAAHQDGMAALKDGDLDKFGDAIAREGALIDEQQENIDKTKAESAVGIKPTT